MAKAKMEVKDVAAKTKTTEKIKATAKAAKTKKTKEPGPHTSTSGAYKSIRHLMETLFAKNKNITQEAFIKAVVKDYPGAQVKGKESKYFKWYHNQIVNHKDFRIVTMPKGF